MKTAVVMIVLLLSAVFIQPSEGWGGFRRAWRHVRRTVNKAVGVVKNTAEGVVNTVKKPVKMCSFGSWIRLPCNHALRGKRSADENENAMVAMTLGENEAICAAIIEDLSGNEAVFQDGIPFGVIKDVFDAVDGGETGDDVLSNEELAEFLSTLEILQGCIDQGQTTAE